jgi:hypothetical protein
MQRMINISLTSSEDIAIQKYLSEKELKLASLVKSLLLQEVKKGESNNKKNKI